MKYNRFITFLILGTPNLRFTVELGGKQTPFIDINIDITDDNIDTCVYHKPTYTSLLLNYLACRPNSWKPGLIQTIINRAYTLLDKSFGNPKI